MVRELRDAETLTGILERHLPWIQEHVSRRLGPALRAKLETQDVVQESLIEVLRYGPRLILEDELSIRRLLAHIAENVLRDQSDWFSRHRRAMQRERPLLSDTVLYLDRPREQVPQPQEEAEQNEAQALLHLAMDLIRPGDRELLVARQWQGLAFVDIGRRLGVEEDAARMRFHRALLRLSDAVDLLREARLDALLDLAAEESDD